MAKVSKSLRSINFLKLQPIFQELRSLSKPILNMGTLKTEHYPHLHTILTLDEQTWRDQVLSFHKKAIRATLLGRGTSVLGYSMCFMSSLLLVSRPLTNQGCNPIHKSLGIHASDCKGTCLSRHAQN